MSSPDYYDTLFNAAEEDDTAYLALKCLERALIDGADPNIRSHEHGETPLTLVSQKGHLETAKLLLETGKGADPDFPNDVGERALMLAAKHGHLEMVELLLERGANVNFGHYKMPALMWASYNGDVAMVKVLLKKGADIHLKSDLGGTALMAACQEGNVEMVKLLLAEVARISIKAHINTKDGKDMTALTWAESEGQEEVVSLLEKHTNEAPEAYTYYELLELKGG